MIGGATLSEALRGRVTKHHRFLSSCISSRSIRWAIAGIDTPDDRGEVEANLDPVRPLIPALTSMPGIGELAAVNLTIGSPNGAP